MWQSRSKPRGALASALALTCLAFGWACGSTAPAGEGARPLQVTAVEPAPSGRVRADASVRVSFDFSRGSSPVRADSLRLLVDGEDVTGQARTAFTEDVPPSQGEISFSPAGPFTPGTHRAEVQFADEQGRRFSFAWSFTVGAD